MTVTRINVILNGETKSLPAGASVAGLLEELGLDTRKVAVERNREIVAKSTYHEATVTDGDVLEIVHFIGGGSQ